MYLFFILLIISTLLISCGGDSKPQTEESNTSDSIIGTWVSNCYQAYFDPENIWSIVDFVITDTTISNNYTNYSDENCTVPYSGSQNLWLGYDGTYTNISTVPTTSGIDAFWYELTFTGKYLNSPSTIPEIVMEAGLYANNDELSLVIEDNGVYNISFTPKYYKQ